jgi:peptidoglycan/LPS O-acetylase OafA/YrhL
LLPLYIFFGIISTFIYYAVYNNEIFEYNKIINYLKFFLKIFDFSIVNIEKSEISNVFGIIWSLRVEYCFYLSLPLIFLLYKISNSQIIASIILVLITQANIRSGHLNLELTMQISIKKV